MFETLQILRCLSFIFCLSLIVACNSSNRTVKQNSSTTEQASNADKKELNRKPDDVITPPIVKDELGPDDISIKGKLLRIVTTGASYSDFPCNKYPCTAEIEIIEMISRGRTYPGNAAKGHVLKVIFPMTLVASDVVFKGLTAMPYPGLKEGNVFQANMTGAQSLDSESLQHTVVFYKVIK